MNVIVAWKVLKRLVFEETVILTNFPLVFVFCLFFIIARVVRLVRQAYPGRSIRWANRDV